MILDKIPVKLKKERTILTSQEASDVMYVTVKFFSQFKYYFLVPYTNAFHIVSYRVKIALHILDGGGK